MRFSYLLYYSLLLNGLFFSAAFAQEENVDNTSFQLLLEAHQFDHAAKLASKAPGLYLRKIIALANKAELASNPVWLKLLHYKTSIVHPHLSQVDGLDYFNSSTGKTDPQAELIATLASFFSTSPANDLGLTSQCRFPARYHWLNKELNFDSTRLPEQECKKFGYFKQALNSSALTVVFPSSHPNSPSSMFGHTLLRFDREGQNRKNRMLAYSANYAAMDNANNDFSYALKGLTGGFIGKFTIIPYYMKLREYSEMESRDIWEYQLNLSKSQVDFVVMHAFELQLTHFDYYFFTENCSYHLLSLIEVAFPELSLTDEFKGAVIPINTVKLLERHNLIANVAYYPSNRQLIDTRRSVISTDKSSLAIDLSDDLTLLDSERLKKYRPLEQAEILDFAYELNRFNKIRSSGKLDTKINHFQRKLLVARSLLKVKTPPTPVYSFDTRPDEGHETSRISLGGGREKNQDYVMLGYRAAYHDIMDPSYGYSPNSQIQFMNLRARYYPSSKSYQLSRLDVIDILSLEPRNDFFKNMSWRINTGVYSLHPKTSFDNLIYTLNGGPGLTYKIESLRQTYVYGFFESELNYSQIYKNDLQMYAGGSAGFLTSITRAWKVNITGKILAYVNNSSLNEYYQYEVMLDQSYLLGKNMSLFFQLSQRKQSTNSQFRLAGGLNFYF